MPNLAARVAQLLPQPEGQYLEFKSLREGPPGRKGQRDRRAVRDDIAQTVAAFANADGGTLVLGREDDGTVTGHDYAEEAVEGFLAVPSQRLVPPLAPGRTCHVAGHDLLVFEVLPTPTAIMVVGDGFPYRVDDRTVLMSQGQIDALKQRHQATSGEAAPARGVRLEDLDRDRIASLARLHGYEANALEPFLLGQRLADRHGSELVLRQAAVLLFARHASRIAHPNAGVRILRVDGTERKVGAEYNVEEVGRFEGALPELLERVYTVVGALIRKSARLHDLFFRETPEYPTFAWQEAIVNAVAHRDYAVEGRGIEVWLYEDRLEVVSPGELLPSISLEALLGRQRVHASRNPRISRALTELGVMRELGEGLPRMFDEMEKSWLPMPELASASGLFSVTLHNTPLFEVGDATWVEAVRRLNLGVRQQRILVASAQGEFTANDYQTLNRVGRDQAYRELIQLVKAGLVQRAGPEGRGRRYSVQREVVLGRVAPTVPPPPPIRGTTAAERQQLADRMYRAGHLKSADLQAVLGLGRAQASRDLNAWLKRGIVAREGKGRWTVYLPGIMWKNWIQSGR